MIPVNVHRDLFADWPTGEYGFLAISKKSPEFSIIQVIPAVRTLDGLDQIASAVAARRRQLAKVPS